MNTLKKARKYLADSYIEQILEKSVFLRKGKSVTGMLKQ